MMKSILATAAIAAFLATPAFAQTGPSLLTSLRDDLAKQTTFKVELQSNAVTLKDNRTGSEVFTMREMNPQTVTLSGVVTSLEKVAPERKQEVMQKIAQFNVSSPVGTMVVDNKTGEVTMHHHLNSRLVSRSGMVNVATRFGDAVREEATVLLQ